MRNTIKYQFQISLTQNTNSYKDWYKLFHNSLYHCVYGISDIGNSLVNGVVKQTKFTSL